MEAKSIVHSSKCRHTLSKCLLLFILGGISCGFISCNNKDKTAWESAKKTDTYAAYDDYITQFPDGEYVTQAETEKEKALWLEATTSNTQDDYENYLEKYETGKYASDAQKKIDELQAKDETEQDVTAKDETEKTPADTKSVTMVRTLLTNYLKSLFSKTFDASKYFAPNVDQFISMMNTTSTKITAYIKDEYHKEFQNGVYIIEEDPFTVTKDDDGNYEATFIEKGECLRKSLNKTQHVRIKVKAILNSDFKITNWQEIQILENKLD